MTRPRAADDFPMIRARMEELRRERSRPRAADDFRMIRARMEELRRERTLAGQCQKASIKATVSPALPNSASSAVCT